MIALDADKMFYITGEPVENAMALINDVEDEDEIKALIGNIHVRICNASYIHQKAIKERARLANWIIEETLKGMKFNDAMVYCCSNFIDNDKN